MRIVCLFLDFFLLFFIPSSFLFFLSFACFLFLYFLTYYSIFTCILLCLLSFSLSLIFLPTLRLPLIFLPFCPSTFYQFPFSSHYLSVSFSFFNSDFCLCSSLLLLYVVQFLKCSETSLILGYISNIDSLLTVLEYILLLIFVYFTHYFNKSI